MRGDKKVYSTTALFSDIFKIPRGLLKDILMEFYLTGRREHYLSYGLQSAEDFADAWLKANQDKYVTERK